MAYKADRLYRIGPTSSKDGWIAPITSWLHGWRAKNAKKQEVMKLLVCNDRLLEDIGVLRADLVRELGYDPRDVPPVYAASIDPGHYLEQRFAIKPNYVTRQR